MVAVELDSNHHSAFIMHYHLVPAVKYRSIEVIRRHIESQVEG